MGQQRPPRRQDGPDRQAIAFVGDHVNYSEFQVLWTTMANLTVPQIRTLGEQWAETPDRRLARGLALGALGHVQGNLAALVVRFADIFDLPLPEPGRRDDNDTMLALLSTLATTPDEPTAGAAAALHDGMLAILAFPPLGAEDYAVLREPWARVCLPCPFTPAMMFGDASPAANAILAELGELPKRRLRLMAAEYRQVPAVAWAAAAERLGEASIASGFPLRERVLYWTCVSQVEDAMGEVPTDIGIVQAVHGMAAARLLADRLDEATTAVLEGPYWRALG